MLAAVRTECADDSVGWVAVGPFRAASQPVVVETNRHEFAAQVEADLHDLRCADPTTDPVVIRAERQPQSWLTAPWTVTRVGEPEGPAVPDETVRVQLIAEVDALALSAGRPGWLPLRAAAVARDGCAVVLAGAHRSGKTTLASRLVRAGWQYLADAVTFVRLEPPFEVDPYWRPFTLDGRPAGTAGPASGAREVIPGSRLGQLAEPTALAAIVVARGPEEPGGLERVGPAASIGPLAAHLPRMPDGRASFHRLAAIASAVPSWTLSFTDPGAVAALDDVAAVATAARAR